MREQQDGNVEDRYRHVRHHPVFGPSVGGTGAGRLPRRAATGPRLVRPGVPAVPSRPAQPRRPIVVESAADIAPLVPRSARPRRLATAGPASGPRLLARRARPAAPTRARFVVRRWVAGATLVVVAALAVVALGLLADAVSGARSSGPTVAPSLPSSVTVEAPGSVWDVAGRLEPGASAAARAELVGRIVTANSLVTGEVRPGQVLVVPSR